MKELEILIKDLKNHFATKESELRENINFNSHTEGFLMNRQSAIESFENACKNAETNPFHKAEVMAEFKKDAEQIKSDIDKITC